VICCLCYFVLCCAMCCVEMCCLKPVLPHLHSYIEELLICYCVLWDTVIYSPVIFINLSDLQICDKILLRSLLFPHLIFCATYCSESISVRFIISPPCISVHSKDTYSLSYGIFALEELLCYVSMLTCQCRPV
jgi:hypothetical protein